MTSTVAGQIRPTQVAKGGGLRGVKLCIARPRSQQARRCGPKGSAWGWPQAGGPLNPERPQEGPRGHSKAAPSPGCPAPTRREYVLLPQDPSSTRSAPSDSCASHFHKICAYERPSRRRDPAPAARGVRFSPGGFAFREAPPRPCGNVPGGCPSPGAPRTPVARGFRSRSFSSFRSSGRRPPCSPPCRARRSLAPARTRSPHPRRLLGKGRGMRKAGRFPRLRAAGFRFHFLVRERQVCGRGPPWRCWRCAEPPERGPTAGLSPSPEAGPARTRDTTASPRGLRSSPSRAGCRCGRGERREAERGAENAGVLPEPAPGGEARRGRPGAAGSRAAPEAPRRRPEG